MNRRVAKKIVQRVRAGEVTSQSYPVSEVKAAFDLLGVSLSPRYLQPWDTARAAKVARTEAIERATARNEGRREQLAEERERLRRLREEKKAAAIARAKATEEALALAKMKAEADAKAMFDAAVPEPAAPATTATAKAADNVVNACDGMKVSDLRALAKERGLSGYSSLKKDELITLLRESN